MKKAARRSVPLESKTYVPGGTGYNFPCFAYQSELIGVKLFHFSGRSSSAKIAVTGQTGTHAPQSMHSVGWIYSCVSLSKFASSLCRCRARQSRKPLRVSFARTADRRPIERNSTTGKNALYHATARSDKQL